MSISIQGRTGWASIPNAIGRSRLPHPTVHLLINLLTHSEGFDASYSLITKQTGMAPATISAALTNLRKLDLVSVKKVAGKSGRFDSNHYTFHADLLWKLSPEFVDERLRGKSAASGNEAGKISTASGAEVDTATGNEAAPLQEMKRKKDQGEPPVENDQPPLPPEGGSVADAPEGDSPDPQVTDSPITETEDRGKNRVKDMQEFGDAYASIEPLTDQHWGELARVWAQLHKKGDLPSQDALLDALRGYYRAVKHNERVSGRFAPKRPANWLRDSMWLATEDELKFPEKESQSGNTLAAWGAPSAQQQSKPDPFALAEADPFANFRHIIDHQEDAS